MTAFFAAIIRISIFLTFLSGTLFMFSCNLSQSSDKAENHLANASSPYLLEHADNPVDWHEWGDEALEKAKKENKPMIISIGYAACHWCHVMEEESFMDTAVANYMNANFVSIKVDREERPDLDEIYVNAAQLISGNAGWPLNAFAFSDGKPFYAGTYFSKEDWLKLMHTIRDAYDKDNAGLVTQAENLTAEIRNIQTAAAKADTTIKLTGEFFNNVYDSLLVHVDFENGGFGSAPKFPMPGSWEFMLQYAYLKKEKKALAATTALLDNLARGGIYDQLGGGFSRYATDSQWRIPHFEKMLYDNAQLVSLYAHAYQYTGDENYKRVIVETLNFIKRELTSQEGGFYSSVNADSEGEEGKFYVWKYSEISDLIDPRELKSFEKVYAITPAGNWEQGKNILYLNERAEIKETGDSILVKARRKLFQVRSKRIRPSLDDKVLTSWNALMMKAYIDAYHATGDSKYLTEATKNAHFIEKYLLKKDYSLQRSFRNGKVSIEGFLEDYAYLADAMLHLYESTFDRHWLELSKGLINKTDAIFFDQESHFYNFTATGTNSGLSKSFSVNDGVTPSPNAVLAMTQYRLGKILYDEKYQSKALSMLALMKPRISKGPAYYTTWASFLSLDHFGTYEVAILGGNADNLREVMQKLYLPNAIFAGGQIEDVPLLEDKLVAGTTRIYVCREKVCKAPTENYDTALRMIKF